MKKLIFFLFIVTLLSACSNRKSKGVVIDGSVDVAVDQPLLLQIDEHDLIPDTISVKNNQFSISIDTVDACIRYLVLGKSSKRIFCASGYQLKVQIKSTAVADSFEFVLAGDGVAENKVMDSVSKLMKTINYRRAFADKEVGAKYLDSAFAEFKRAFGNITLEEELAPEFIEIQNASLRYSLAAFKLAQGIQNEIKDTAHYSFLRNIDIEKEEYMEIPEYRWFMESYLHVQTNKNLTEESTEEECLDSILSSIDKLKSQKIREYFIFDRIYPMVEGDALQNEGKYIQYFKWYNTNPKYVKAMQQLVSQKDRFGAGKPAPDFSLLDLSGKSVSLKNFKGKYVLIDFWASWCHPCMEELPHFIKLQADYKDKNVAFLAVSLDQDKEVWKELVKGKPLDHVYAENGTDPNVVNIGISYQVTAIPLTVLIDTKGNFIDHNAPVPSSKEIRSVLDSLLLLKK